MRRRQSVGGPLDVAASSQRCQAAQAGCCHPGSRPLATADLPMPLTEPRTTAGHDAAAVAAAAAAAAAELDIHRSSPRQFNR